MIKNRARRLNFRKEIGNKIRHGIYGYFIFLNDHGAWIGLTKEQRIKTKEFGVSGVEYEGCFCPEFTDKKELEEWFLWLLRQDLDYRLREAIKETFIYLKRW